MWINEPDGKDDGLRSCSLGGADRGRLLGDPLIRPDQIDCDTGLRPLRLRQYSRRFTGLGSGPMPAALIGKWVPDIGVAGLGVRIVPGKDDLCALVGPTSANNRRYGGMVLETAPRNGSLGVGCFRNRRRGFVPGCSRGRPGPDAVDVRQDEQTDHKGHCQQCHPCRQDRSHPFAG